MKIFKIIFIIFSFESLVLFQLTKASLEELMEVKSTLRNSASRYLYRLRSEINEEVVEANNNRRRKREVNDNDYNFITELDRLEIEKCNNIVTFLSKKRNLRRRHRENSKIQDDNYIRLYFNTTDMPNDLNLIHSTLRIYHDPELKKIRLIRNQEESKSNNITISIYKRIIFHPTDPDDFQKNFRILTSLNMTSDYKGWLEFNITSLLGKWIKYRKWRSQTFLNELLIDATDAITEEEMNTEINARQLGFIYPDLEEDFSTEQSPFVIGFFNGPQLIENLQKLRLRREIMKRRRPAITSFNGRGLPPQQSFQMPKICERFNFTVNFREIYMDDVIIAPPKFEAYFCAGECNFPLGAKTNATNHAIVQTLMQLKRPHLPKPCCVPTAMEPIYILRFLKGEDTYNLVKHPESVVIGCGCR